MKHILLSSLLVLTAALSGASVSIPAAFADALPAPVPAATAPKFTLDDFAFNLEQTTADPHHIWVTSGYSTVNPTFHTVTGVNEFYAPPFAAKKFWLKVDIQADDRKFVDTSYIYSRGLRYSGGTWLPHKIIRHGTYHWRKGGKLISLGVTSELVPLFGSAGFVEKISFTNRAPEAVQLKVTPSISPGTPILVPLNHWGYGQPGSRTPGTVKSPAPDRWESETASLAFYRSNTETALEPGKTFEVTFTVLVGKKGEVLPATVDAAALMKNTEIAWQKRLDKCAKSVPVLTSNIPGLDNYYKRAILSGLVCIWENPDFALNPFLATCGVDGGAVCGYLWDNAGYQPNLVSMMLGDGALEMARKMVSIDLEKSYAVAPSGTGVGVKYSYSTVAFTRLVCAIFKFNSPQKDLFDYAKKLVLNDEKRQLPNGLIDYGFQHNLLEMQGSGYEHIVVSPNAERAWCLDQLAELGKKTGATQEEIATWKQESKKVITAVRKELWDEKKQWFAAIHPDGFKDYVYTIQVFDALGAGACTPAMEQAVLAQLTEKGYLGTHGMSAVSKIDTLHYEAIDNDWGGGGSYVGDGPQTALILYERGHAKLAWDILRRHFWMGNTYIYYPQEHFCDRPLAPPHTRPNEISGMCGAEAILFGLIGFQPQYDGTLLIHPQVTESGTINIKGFVYRENAFDVEVSAKSLKVLRNGKVIYEGVPKRVKIL
jgi:hypothetical protein